MYLKQPLMAKIYSTARRWWSGREIHLPSEGQVINGKKLTSSTAFRIDALQEFQSLSRLPYQQARYLHHRSLDTRRLRWNGSVILRMMKGRRPMPKTGDGLSRINYDVDDPSVPGWITPNVASSIHDLPLTTTGMLFILQAPANNNDTLTTVINRLMDISNYVGQKHTIITADQPLYNRGQELLRTNA